MEKSTPFMPFTGEKIILEETEYTVNRVDDIPINGLVHEDNGFIAYSGFPVRFQLDKDKTDFILTMIGQTNKSYRVIVGDKGWINALEVNTAIVQRYSKMPIQVLGRVYFGERGELSSFDIRAIKVGPRIIQPQYEFVDDIEKIDPESYFRH